jgi:hypothetical protein
MSRLVVPSSGTRHEFIGSAKGGCSGSHQKIDFITYLFSGFRLPPPVCTAKTPVGGIRYWLPLYWHAPSVTVTAASAIPARQGAQGLP